MQLYMYITYVYYLHSPRGSKPCQAPAVSDPHLYTSLLRAFADHSDTQHVRRNDGCRCSDGKGEDFGLRQMGLLTYDIYIYIYIYI